MTFRVGFLTTHPIQYQVPVFRELSALPDIDLTVYYCQLPDQATQGAEFGVDFAWDIPLLDGYRYEVLDNRARHPSVTQFRGCDTPGIDDVIRRHKFDAFVVNGWVVKSCLQALRACRRWNVPCLVRGEANLLRPRPWWKQVAHRRLLRRFQAFLYIGEENRRYYRHFGVREEQLFPARYCIDNDRFAAAAAEAGRRERGRRTWHIGERDTCFVYCGKFIPKKHPLELLQSFEQALQRTPHMHLLMVGDGELRSACEAFAQARRLPVTFTGFLNQSQIVDAYVSADLLVLPSDFGETWGLVVNEAMACGRAAIVSDQAGCRADLIHEGQTGHSFAFGEWNQLANRLSEVAQSGMAEQMGEQARQRVAQYSPLAAAHGILAAVSSVGTAV